MATKIYPICSCGKAMISTMSFSGKEYWCWNCGNTEAFFCSVDREEISSEEEKQVKEKYKEAQEFLDARGCKYGGGMRKIDDDYLPYHALPEHLKREIDSFADSWEYKNE